MVYRKRYNCKRRGNKSCSSSKLNKSCSSSKLTKEDISCVVRHHNHNWKKRIFDVWFVIKAITQKEDDPHIIHHQNHNCRRRCTKCGLFLKSKFQKKSHQVWIIIKVENTKIDASCVTANAK